MLLDRTLVYENQIPLNFSLPLNTLADENTI
jgi:hypothetical protein